MINIIDILNDSLKLNTLNLSISQAYCITNCIKSSSECLKQIKYLVLSIQNDGFKISDISSLTFGIAKILNDTEELNELETVKLLFIHFILVSLIESDVFLIKENQKLDVNNLIVSSIDLLKLSLHVIEKETSFLSKHACCF